MQKETPVPATEVLKPGECWRLLRGVSFGRLALWVGDHPEIFPINFRIEQDAILFRTGSGTKQSAALKGSPVAFEADGINANTNTAWSVVVKGEVEEIEPTEEFLRELGPRLFAWEPAQKDHFLIIPALSITGRRFTIEAPYTWDSSLDEATGAGLE